MKKLISFAVAVLMLLSIAVPVTFAADTDPVVTGKATTTGSVEGLAVNGEAVTSSQDYIDKMGYAEDDSWIAITEVSQISAAFMKNDAGKCAGKYYLAGNITFTDAITFDSSTAYYLLNPNDTSNPFVLDGCGYSILGLDMRNTASSALFMVSNGSTNVTLKNITFGSSTNHVKISANGAGGIFQPQGTFVVENMCIWADVTNSGTSGTGIFAGYTHRSANVSISNTEINGFVKYTGTGTAGTAGFITNSRGSVSITNCTNNALVDGGNGTAAGFYGIHSGSYTPAVSITGCVNNGTVASAGATADAICTSTSTTVTLNNNFNTGMVTQVVDGVKTTEVPTGINEPKAFIQMSDGEETYDIRFILAMSEAEYTAAAESLSFKISFKMTDGKVYSKNFNEIVAFNSVVTEDETYNAADGVVFCGVIVTDVVDAEWTKCGISYGGDTWAYTK